MIDSLPRVLRIGIVHNGNIIHERLIPPTERVTLGSHPGATFTVPGLLETAPLFIPRKGRYRLDVPAGAHGRVATATGVVDLQTFHASRGNRPLLEDTDRGKIVIGDITVLFQLVDAPPMPVRMLKGSFRPRLIDEDDPLFLGILSLCGAAAAVMMVHISTLATPALVQFDEIPDYFAHNISLTAPIEDPVDVEAPPEPEAIEVVVEQPVEVVETPPDVPDEPVEVVALKPMTEEERAIADALAQQVRKDDVIQRSALLRGLLRNRGEGEDIFGTNDTIGQELIGAVDEISSYDDVAVSDEGSRQARDTHGRGEAGLEGGVARAGSGEVEIIQADATTSEHTITGQVEPEPPPVKDDIKTQVATALRLLNPRIRTCYERRIKEDPTINGRLVLEVDIVGGRVADVFVSGDIYDAKLTACVESAASKWQVPGVDGETLVLPFVLSAVE